MPRRVMPGKRNHKYRFNGAYGMKASLTELRGILIWLKKKLADPDNGDDPVWVRNWIAATEAEIAKKESAAATKTRERRKASDRRGRKSS